jgi:hypothetical protein
MKRVVAALVLAALVAGCSETGAFKGIHAENSGSRPVQVRVVVLLEGVEVGNHTVVLAPGEDARFLADLPDGEYKAWVVVTAQGGNFSIPRLGSETFRLEPGVLSVDIEVTDKGILFDRRLADGYTSSTPTATTAAA